MKIIKLLSIVTILVAFATGARADVFQHPVFQAMNDEMKRSMTELQIENMPAPYFIAYSIQERDIFSLESRFGAITTSARHLSRRLGVNLRVGDFTFDNTNYYPDWRAVFNNLEDLVEEDNYDAVRHQLWLHTDKAYKSALENIARKRAYLDANPQNELIPDFTPAQAHVFEQPTYENNVDEASWRQRIHLFGQAFNEFPKIQDWNLNLTIFTTTNRFLNSEGSKNIHGNLVQMLTVSATIQADDGERISAFRDYVTKNDGMLPEDQVIVAELRELAQQLQSAAASEPLDEYEGPVLFSELAAAQFLSQMFVEQLILPRKVFTEQSWMEQYLPQGKLSKRVNRRVFPDFINLIDDPLQAEFNGKNLVGSLDFDSEGLPAQPLTLVKNGWLQTLPCGRTPGKKVSGSNGHARLLPNQMIVPGISNLTLESDRKYSTKKLLKKLRNLCQDYGNEYGLMVLQLESPDVSDKYQTIDRESDENDLITRPMLVVKVYADDGRTEAVRGLSFDEVSIRSLRDIMATGKNPEVYNLTQTALFSDYQYLATIITPSILIEEMELKGGTLQEPLPIMANPYFE